MAPTKKQSIAGTLATLVVAATSYFGVSHATNPASISDAQAVNAALIVGSVKAHGYPEAAAVLIVQTSLVETGLLNLASANVPASVGYPHDRWGGSSDGLGHDHASMGILQQQTGCTWTKAGCPAGTSAELTKSTLSGNGWGTPATIMDPAKATGLFLAKLAAIKGYASMDSGAVIQRIQGSAYPDRYDAQRGKALGIVSGLWERIKITPVSVTSLPVPPAPKPPVKPIVPANSRKAFSAPRPKITGTAHPHRLTAVRGTWTPQAASVSYQWLHNGKPIKGATSYRLVLKYSGTYAVKIIGRLAGYVAKTVQSVGRKTR